MMARAPSGRLQIRKFNGQAVTGAVLGAAGFPSY
jgi:hypothetical protein